MLKNRLCTLSLILASALGLSAPVLAQMNVPVLKIKARGTLLNGVGPKMGVYIDGRLVQNYEINHTEFREIVLASSALQPNSKVDLFFSNDKYEGPGKDINLIVESITVTGSNAAGVYKSAQVGVYDKGDTYALATDGKNTLTGKEGMADNGAMRFVLKGNGGGGGGETPVPGGMISVGQSRSDNVLDGAAMRTANAGQYMIMDNPWGIRAGKGYPYKTDDWFVKTSISKTPAADGGVAAKFEWQFLSDQGSEEVKAYPGIVYGHWMGGSVTAPHLYGKRVNELQSLVSTYKIGANRGEGAAHLAYDIWLTNTKDCRNGYPCRTHELLIPLKVYGGYGNDRGAPKVSGVCGALIDGKKYTVYKYPAAWNFMVFEPCQFKDADTVNVKAFFDYLKTLPEGKGKATGNEFFNSVEFGVEAATYNYNISKSPKSLGGITVDYYNVQGR